ncbi:hypothetical protein [Hymenobacter sp.]|jgi:hypothetical protein|uniref:hypothetical protein n=1 Tax=Hymenobacter sp. TaxID=1898978 RepID=UPI002EDA1FA9
MTLEQQVAAHFQRYNTSPQAGFCGLSPAQMHQLLYQPLAPGCPVQLQTAIPDETLDQVPFLRLTEDFLALVQREGAIKLTPLGALPRKYLHELYAHGHIPERGIDTGFIKLSRELDSLSITTLHTVGTEAGLVKKTTAS